MNYPQKKEGGGGNPMTRSWPEKRNSYSRWGQYDLTKKKIRVK